MNSSIISFLMSELKREKTTRMNGIKLSKREKAIPAPERKR